MKGDLISVLGLISSAWGSSSQPRQLISYNYIACIIKLLICSLILKLSYSEPWALRSIKSWDFQVRCEICLWGSFYYYYSSLSLFLKQKNTRPSNKTWKKCNMSKGYYLASLLHVLIRFFYGDVQYLPYFFIFYSCFLIMKECLWVILINWINIFLEFELLLDFPFSFYFINPNHLHFLIITAINL